MTITLPRSDLLIKKARIGSGEEDFSDGSYGIDTAVYLEALQDASAYIQMMIVNERAETFATTSDEIAATGAAYINVPTDIFINHMVYNVFYAQTSGGRFEELDFGYVRNHDPYNGRPTEYILEGDKIYFDRIPTTGVFKVRYEKRLDRIELRRGKVTSTTGTLPNLTAITIDITDTAFYNEEDWTTDAPEYLSINDRDGNVLMRNIPFSSYNTTTGVITLDTFTAESGETCPVGSWVLFGGNSTTHSKLPEPALPFFKEYLKSLAYEARSADDFASSNPRMKELLAQIIDAYAQLPSGFAGVPLRR